MAGEGGDENHHMMSQSKRPRWEAIIYHQVPADVINFEVDSYVKKIDDLAFHAHRQLESVTVRCGVDFSWGFGRDWWECISRMHIIDECAAWWEAREDW